MTTWTADSAHTGAPKTQSPSDHRPLAREDQTALELGFPPAGGLNWRRRRVHQLRERIERGTYEVDPGQVAEAMLARMRETS